MKGRVGASPTPPGSDGKRKAGEGGDGGGKDEKAGKPAAAKHAEEDPLGLIRREVAVMKKLEWV